MELNRVTSGVRFDTGISTADWTRGTVGQTPGQTQGPLLPGSTTVTETLKELFPTGASVGAEIMDALAAAGGSPLLRTAAGFRSAAVRTIRTLRGKKGEKAGAAARELENLLADTELLDHYRAALLET